MCVCVRVWYICVCYTFSYVEKKFKNRKTDGYYHHQHQQQQPKTNNITHYVNVRSMYARCEFFNTNARKQSKKLRVVYCATLPVTRHHRKQSQSFSPPLPPSLLLLLLVSCYVKNGEV